MFKRETLEHRCIIISHQTSEDARDLATVFLLHERIEHFASAAGGGQRGLGLFNLLPHVPDRSLGLSILLRNMLQLLLILRARAHTILDYTLKNLYVTTVKFPKCKFC